jgi:hypothetical protein
MYRPIFLAVLILAAGLTISEAAAQTFTVSTDRAVYQPGDTIVVRATLLAATGHGSSIVFGSVTPNCQARFFVGGKDIAEDNDIGCLASEEQVFVAAGQGLTWEIAIDPAATGLPVVEGLQSVSARLSGWWGTLNAPGAQFELDADPTYIIAPRSSGGTLSVSFPRTPDESWLDAIRDEFSATVVNRTASPTSVTEIWRLDGVWSFDAAERLGADPRFRWATVLFDLPVHRREATPGEGLSVAGHWMLEEGTRNGAPIVEPFGLGRTVIVFTRQPADGTDAYILRGHTGCSHFSGSYRAVADELHVDFDVVDEIFQCLGGDEILAAMADDWPEGASYAFDSGALHIDFGSDRMTFLSLHIEPDPGLRGAQWTFFDANLNGRSIGSDGEPATRGELDFNPLRDEPFRFYSTGLMYAGSFCNSIEGTFWTGPGNRLIAQGEITTLISCEHNPDLDRLDVFQWDDMRRGAKYAIEDGVLTIKVDAGWVRFSGTVRDTTQVDRYLPLAIGNTWVYRYDESGPMMNWPFMHAGYRRYTVVGDTTVQVARHNRVETERFFRIMAECFDRELRSMDRCEDDHLVRIALPGGFLLSYDQPARMEHRWQGFDGHLASGLSCGLSVSFPHPDREDGYDTKCRLGTEFMPVVVGGGYERSLQEPLSLATTVKSFSYPFGTWVEFAADVGIARSGFEHHGGSELILEHAMVDGESFGSPVVGLSAGDLPGIVGAFALHGNYPNPFHPTTAVEFTLGRPAEVGVEVYDLLGRKVIVVEPRLLEAGARQQIVIDGSGLPSGMYLYRVTLARGEVLGSGRMVVLR